MDRDHTDITGRTWPAGTAYRPLSRGTAIDATTQRIVVESSHYQDVLTEGFGKTAEFIER